MWSITNMSVTDNRAFWHHQSEEITFQTVSLSDSPASDGFKLLYLVELFLWLNQTPVVFKLSGRIISVTRPASDGFQTVCLNSFSDSTSFGWFSNHLFEFFLWLNQTLMVFKQSDWILSLTQPDYDGFQTVWLNSFSDSTRLWWFSNYLVAFLFSSSYGSPEPSIDDLYVH